MLQARESIKLFFGKSSLKVFTSRLIWHLLLWVQGAGIITVLKPSGLDLGYNWAVTSASRTGLFGKGLFIGPYGPLGFLEFAYPEWSIGFLLSILWKMALSSALFEILVKIIIRPKVNINFSFVIAIVLVTITNAISMPNTLLIIIFLIRAILNKPWHPKISRYEASLDGFILLIAFFIKPLPFSLAMISSLIYYFNNKQTLRNLTKMIGSFVSCGIITLYSLGFTIDTFAIWLRGYSEISSGYTEMSSEDSRRILEYPMIFGLFLFIIFHLWRTVNKKTLLGVLAILYLVFRYGFNRHDGHSIFSFLITFFLILALSAIQNYRKLKMVYLSFAILLLVSNYSIAQLLDFNARANNSYLAVNMITNSNFREAQLKIATQQAIIDYKIPKEIFEAVQSNEVAVLPLPENLNLLGAKTVLPPMSSLFSAYTPWLDEINAKWITSSNAPKFLLLQPPTTIDGRFPWWDSPRFWMATLCNYQVHFEGENWLLLSKRTKSLCQDMNLLLESKKQGQMIELRKTTPTEIYVVNMVQEESLVDKVVRTLFKPINPDTVLVNKLEYRLVWKNQGYLPVFVPEQINLPGRWRLAPVQEIQTSNHTHYQVFKIPLTQ